MDVDARSLAALATAVWQLRNKIAEHPHRRHVRPLFDAMDAFGLETRQYDSVPFDAGMEVRVLAIQPAEGLDREKVIETVRPAVYLRGILIQPGEVIVGRPPTVEITASAPTVHADRNSRDRGTARRTRRAWSSADGTPARSRTSPAGHS